VLPPDPAVFGTKRTGVHILGFLDSAIGGAQFRGDRSRRTQRRAVSLTPYVLETRGKSLGTLSGREAELRSADSPEAAGLPIRVMPSGSERDPSAAFAASTIIPPLAVDPAPLRRGFAHATTHPVSVDRPPNTLRWESPFTDGVCDSRALLVHLLRAIVPPSSIRSRWLRELYDEEHADAGPLRLRGMAVVRYPDARKAQSRSLSFQEKKKRPSGLQSPWLDRLPAGIALAITNRSPTARPPLFRFPRLSWDQTVALLGRRREIPGRLKSLFSEGEKSRPQPRPRHPGNVGSSLLRPVNVRFRTSLPGSRNLAPPMRRRTFPYYHFSNVSPASPAECGDESFAATPSTRRQKAPFIQAYSLS